MNDLNQTASDSYELGDAHIFSAIGPTADLITKVTRTFPRIDGSEVRIVAVAMRNPNMSLSTDFWVDRRESATDDWVRCRKEPHPNWKAMPRTDYLRFGRSEMLQAVSAGEILQVTSLIGKPMSCLN